MVKDIIVIGSVAFDSITTIKGQKESLLGGSATYFSLAASLFAKVHLVGVVGTDFNQEYVKLFHSKNISTEYLQYQKGNTFKWGGIYSDDFKSRKTLFTNLGVFEKFNPIIDSSELEYPILFLANIQPSLQMNIIKQVHNPSLIVLDTMNLWIDNNYDELIEVIKVSDILLINDEEIIQLTNQTNLELAGLKLLDLGLKYIIIKKGAKGSLILSKDNKISIPAISNIDVYDPTGAGDSFAGGFIGYLACHNRWNAKDIIAATLYGTAIASYTVSSFGTNGIENLALDNIKKRIKLIEDLIKGF